MAEERKKKSEIRVEEVVAEHNSMKKKKNKSRENTGEDVGIAAIEREKLGDDDVVDKKSKKKAKQVKVDSEADDNVKKSKKKKKIMEKRVDSEVEDNGKKSMKKAKEVIVDSEAGKKLKKKIKVDSEIDGNVKKKESDGDEGNQREAKKRKLNDSDLRAEENTDKSNKELGRKRKKKKPNADSDVEETNLCSTKDANKINQSEDSEVEVNNEDSTRDANKEKKKRKKQSDDSVVGENNKDSTTDVNKKQIEDSEADEIDLNSKKDAKKKKKQMEAEEVNLNSTKDSMKKKKQEEESNKDSTKDAKKKRKKKQKSDKDVTTPSSTKSTKKVKFSDKVEIFPSEDDEESEEENEEDKVEMVRGKRFTKEEDALLKKAVSEYIDNHALGDEGLNMILQCKSHPELKGCWKEIANALPWRPYTSVYYRAHIVFEEGSKGIWTEEDLELVKEFQKKHGNDWKTLADAMGKHRVHVKDAWRRIRLAANKGHWSREEYQSLFDLVNSEIRMKAYKEKHSKHGMLRDNIPWMAISDQLGTRDHAICCTKWYDQLTSPMVAKGIWANVDDYRLLEELVNLDAACIDDVDWDNLLENRDGEACRKRWNQMVLHIGTQGSKTFAEQVEILSERYCPELAEDREDFDNRTFDD